MVKIIVDCFGGDRSPQANIDGSLAALSGIPELSLILAGDEKIIKELLSGRNYDASRLEILDAPQVISCNERPTDAIRLKKDSSMIKAIRLLRDNDEIAGMVSIGSTGALVAAALTRLGRLEGVIRPAFCPIVPTVKGGICSICDSGANVEVTPAHLRQFAIMSSVYLENVYGVKSPRIALLNVGKEAEKGDTIRQEAYKLLQETECINFVGNMESRDLLSGDYDVIVCDGFSGNVLTKATEGAAIEIMKRLKKAIYSKWIYKIGALLLKGMFKAEKEFFNYQNYGGSVLIGTTKVVVKGHGSSNATAVKKCIEQAYRMQISGLNPKIETEILKYEHYDA